MYKGSSQTCYKLELRNRILKAAMTEFLHKGVKSVKMDDIANTLAISKRTLYEIYSNKEELLLEAVRIHEQEFNDHMLQYSLDKNHNVMDIIIEFYKKSCLTLPTCRLCSSSNCASTSRSWSISRSRMQSATTTLYCSSIVA